MVGIEEGIVVAEVGVEVHTDIEAMKSEGILVILIAEDMMTGIETGITTMREGQEGIEAQALFIGDSLVLLGKVVKKGVQKLRNGIGKGKKQQKSTWSMIMSIELLLFVFLVSFFFIFLTFIFVCIHACGFAVRFSVIGTLQSLGICI